VVGGSVLEGVVVVVGGTVVVGAFVVVGSGSATATCRLTPRPVDDIASAVPAVPATRRRAMPPDSKNLRRRLKGEVSSTESLAPH
jgi:hypothetical protein